MEKEFSDIVIESETTKTVGDESITDRIIITLPGQTYHQDFIKDLITIVKIRIN